MYDETAKRRAKNATSTLPRPSFRRSFPMPETITEIQASASLPSPVTVREVLSLPVVRRGVPEVLAGQDALEREIRWVHSGEVPNIAALLKGGELLLTTGMGIGQSQAEQRRFVATLANRGIAALAVELGRRWRRYRRP